MPAEQRWQFINILTGSTWTVPINPNAMTAPCPQRKYTVKGDDGRPWRRQHVVYEASPDPKPWTFSGDLPDLDHVNGLLAWSWRHKQDQDCRPLQPHVPVTLDQFDVIPAQVRSHMQRHTYTMHATVYRAPPGGSLPLPPGSLRQ